MGIPTRETPRLPVRHIDTDILRGMLDETGKDDLWKVGRHLRNTIKSSHPLGVSQPAIGEAFHTLSETSKIDREACEAAAGMFRKLVQSAKIVLVGNGDAKNSVFEIAQRLRTDDYRITMTDALILSVACSCESCNELTTTDGVLLTSMKAKEIAKEFGVRIKPPDGADEGS